MSGKDEKWILDSCYTLTLINVTDGGNWEGLMYFPEQNSAENISLYISIYIKGESLSVRCNNRLLVCLWANLTETLMDGRVGHGYHCHQVAPQSPNRGRRWIVKGALSQLSVGRFA